MDAETRLAVRGLEKRFDSGFALSGVDLTVGRDEIVALLGPSGCGKTTVLRCIAGVESPEAGEITVGGDLVEGPGVSRPPEQRDVGMVYQNYAVWPHKTVYENVVFPLKHADHSVPRDEYEQRVEEVLELVEIPELRDAPATDLSGGQQQRTALARALVHDPDLLLLDEPLSNLDTELRKGMRYELQRIQHEFGVSMLYVTHDQEEAFYLADEVLVMNEGRVVERGSPRELHERPRSAFTRQFVGVRNRFEGRVESGEDAGATEPDAGSGAEPDGGGAVVRTDVCTLLLDAVDVVADGTVDGAVACFLRPDRIDVDPDGAGTNVDPDGAGTNADRDRVTVPGTVVAEGILGDRYEATVRLDGRETELVVHADDYRDLDRGDAVALSFSPGAVQVYPASDE